MEKREVGFLVTEEYISWINEIKEKIKGSQLKASVRVNVELLDLYWSIGKEIIDKQENAKWGDSTHKSIERRI